MRFNSGFWRKCRIGFRWFRIATLLAVLALVCAFVWFNRVGLPEFLKRPLGRTTVRPPALAVAAGHGRISPVSLPQRPQRAIILALFRGNW